MKSRPARAVLRQAVPSPAASHPSEHAAIKVLAVTAFLLLAIALCGRALLSEARSATAAQLVSSPEGRASGTLMARHVAHLVAAGGIGLVAVWMAVSRRPWRLCGLEIGIGILVVASLLSVPVASDKRAALNMVLDQIVPLLAAAALYQMLVDRLAWRRALLAGILAVAAANCWQATWQHVWEYPRSWETYQQNKVQFWTQQGISLNDPRVAEFEAASRAPRPIGFIQGANVLSSFLLLGLAAAGAAVAGSGWRCKGRQSAGQPHTDEPAARDNSPEQASVRPDGNNRGPATARRLVLWVALPCAAALVLWHVVALAWVHTVGSAISLLAAGATGVAVLLWRHRPRRLAIVLAVGLLLLQTALVVLATQPDLRADLMAYRGPLGKARSLAARFFIYDGAIQLFRQNPLTGVGPSQFGNRYLQVMPPELPRQFNDAHNWLINTAAERGVFGVVGVLAALFGCGWTIVRGLASRAADDAPRPRGTAALLPTLVVALGCWLMLAMDLPRGAWSQSLSIAVAVSLAAGAGVSLCALSGRAGQGILLAGLVGFFVHCTAEVTPSVPGVMWPFWGLVAVAMAWSGSSSPAVAEPAVQRRRWMLAGPVLAAVAALVVVAMTVRPMRAVSLMHEAQQAAVRKQPQVAVELLRRAADADPLDPLPLRTAALLEYRQGMAAPNRAVNHFRRYLELCRAAVERNPLDHGFWRAQSMAEMFLATATGDFVLVDKAVGSMRTALDLNPLWPEGWLELARMAAVEAGAARENPSRLQVAVDAAEKALALDDGRPSNVHAMLTAQQRAELLAIQEQVRRRLQAVTAQPPAASSHAKPPQAASDDVR